MHPVGIERRGSGSAVGHDRRIANAYRRLAMRVSREQIGIEIPAGRSDGLSVAFIGCANVIGDDALDRRTAPPN